jgi:hypothetical protein
MMVTRIAFALVVLVCATGADNPAKAIVDEIKRREGEALRARLTAWTIRIDKPDSDDGRHLGIGWKRERAHPEKTVLVLRRTASDDSLKRGPLRVVTQPGSLFSPGFLFPSGRLPWSIPRTHYAGIDASKIALPAKTVIGVWTVVASFDGDPAEPIVDEVDYGGRYQYVLIPAIRGDAPDTYREFVGDAIATWEVSPRATWFNRKLWFHFLLISLIAASLFGFTWLAKRRKLFVRRLAGVDAIENAVGRSTEMGRPILYVTGVEKTEDIQTIASILILGHVAEIAAAYDTDLKVANAFPLTMVLAEEVVRQGYANAGRADAHRPEDVLFITSEQFAFAAAVQGIIVRERPATNIYFGRFYAESLMLAETGFLTGAVQIAGTGELTQLPFFISACDFTLIGEELFACSAYLSNEPNQVALLKAGDVLKVVIAVLVVATTLFATMEAAGYSAPFTMGDLLP